MQHLPDFWSRFYIIKTLAWKYVELKVIEKYLFLINQWSEFNIKQLFFSCLFRGTQALVLRCLCCINFGWGLLHGQLDVLSSRNLVWPYDTISHTNTRSRAQTFTALAKPCTVLCCSINSLFIISPGTSWLLKESDCFWKWPLGSCWLIGLTWFVGE